MVDHTSKPEPGLLSIGQFSSFSRLSIRMLRYYDQHGVLSPAWIDPDSSYRYYLGSQLADAALVRSLRDVGFSVAAIAGVVPVARDRERLRHALAVQREQLTHEAGRVERQLADLDRFVHSLTEVGMSTNIEITILPARELVALRDTIPSYNDEGLLWQRFMAAVGQQRVPVSYEVAGATFHDEDYRESDVDVEVWMPAASGVRVEAPLISRQTPEQRVLMARYLGGYEGIAGAIEELGLALSARGLTAAGPMFNHYIVGPAQTDDPAAYVTEICIPVG